MPKIILFTKLKKFLILLHKKTYGKHTILILPFETDKNHKKLKKITNKLIQTSRTNVVLSKDLYKIEEFKNQLYKKNSNILNGRWLWNYLLEESVNYISEQQEIPLQEQEITIMANENLEVNLKNIIQLSQKVKHMNIVTNNINKFKPIEEYLYNKLGIMITITNNKKKALKRTNIIINLDFTEEELNQYSLPHKAIILSINKNIKIYSKKFAGINIVNYKIKLPKEYIELFDQYYILEEFDHNILYESMLYTKDNYENIALKIKANKSKIECFIGNNGMIQSNEYKFSQ